MIAPTFFKSVPCNLYDASVVVLVQKIVAEHAIRPDEITRMILRPSRDIKGHGGDGSGGSMSQWLSVRLNAAHGACGTRPYSAWQNGEPPPQEVARLVDLASIEPYVETGPPDVRYWEGYVPTSVTIETVKGTFDDHMPLLQRLTEAQLLEKFVDNVAPAIGEAGARELADLRCVSRSFRAQARFSIAFSPNADALSSRQYGVSPVWAARACRGRRRFSG